MNLFPPAFLVAAVLALAGPLGAAAPVPGPLSLDLRRPGSAGGWTVHDAAGPRVSSDGLLVELRGRDPQLTSPALSPATNEPLVLRLRLRSDAGGLTEVFWHYRNAGEREPLCFVAATNDWTEVTLPLPPLTGPIRLRVDPPGTNGACRLQTVAFEPVAVAGVTGVVASAESLRLQVVPQRTAFHVVDVAPWETLEHARRGIPVATWQPGDAAELVVPRLVGEGAGRRDRLYSGWLAVRSEAGADGVLLGTVHHVENPGDLAPALPPGPLPRSKKGLQVQMVDDALTLGIQHAALNLDLGGLLDLTHNPANPSWTVDGETFHFRRAYLDHLGVRRLSDAGMAVYLIILSYRSGNPAADRLLLHPQCASNAPNRLAAFNTCTPEGFRAYRACLEFLGNWFSGADPAHGRVTGYVIGNELNSHWHWYNMGRAPRDLVVEDYLRAVRAAHTAVRRSSSAARVYLSLEHHWTIPFEKDRFRGCPGRPFIEEFARRARFGGDFDWDLAHHPYPENLFNPRTWQDRTAQPTVDSPRITFRNLEQLVDFMARPEWCHRGQPRRIILSEQGFHSDRTPRGDELQAAAYAYAWRKVAALGAIDAFILHRHVDHQHEGGLNLGLWARRPGTVATSGTRAPIYEVFRAADGPDWEPAFAFALPVIGITNWSQVLPKVRPVASAPIGGSPVR